MATFGWGSTVNGELGLGGIEEDFILTPREIHWTGGAELEQAACGTSHTLLLTKQGKVFSCGNNDYGQLGHDLSRKRPQFVSSLDNYMITQLSSGAMHSMALNEWGQVFTWGSDTHGQLGNELGAVQATPRVVRSLSTKHVIQIVSGHFHCLALTNSGEIYAWGMNNYGQLGIGQGPEKVSKPMLVEALSGIPIAFICCGAHHSFALSTSGAIFAWGKNNFGQLGLNNETHHYYPQQIRGLRSLGVRHIACGDDFSVFLTADGRVFTCGLGSYGQLGHGGNNNEITPRMVLELAGSTITQVSCGRKHTLAFVPSRGRVYGFGLGHSGQLGMSKPRNVSIPQVVNGPWISSGPGIRDGDEGDIDGPGMKIRRIFSGGDHCFVSAVEKSSNISSYDCRIYDEKTQICQLSLEMASSFSDLSKDSNVDLDVISILEVIFKNQSCLNGSFLKEMDEHRPCTSKNHGVDIAIAESAFEYIRKIENETIKDLIWESITTDLIQSLKAKPPDVETLRIYLILPLYHEFINSKNYPKLHTPFCQAVLRLTEYPSRIVHRWWAEQSVEYFERLIECFKGVVTYIVNFQYRQEDGARLFIGYEKNLHMALNLMLNLFVANHKYRTVKVSCDAFYINDLHETVDIQKDYVSWLQDKDSSLFHLCCYPFIFDVAAKTLLLQTDQRIQMHNAMQSATAEGLLQMVVGGSQMLNPFLALNVSRENLVQDTINELQKYSANEYKRPLRIKFHGEEAEDAGGVKKEFFMLLLKEILDPKFGMFKEYEESRYIWFSNTSFEGAGMYTLIGILCGLAIYNFTIIDLPFPLALYKKILQEAVDLSDLKELSPTVGASMEEILAYEGDDLEQVFCVTFSITEEVFGERRTVDLKPNGRNIGVTQENKEEFVNLYIDYVFNRSCKTHFEGFDMGFQKVCGGRIMHLFTSRELMAMVVGNENYDWFALQETAEYRNGYSSSDQTVQWFWEVFHELSLKDKKNFLLYLTGSSRIPIQGMKAIKIYIQPTPDDRFLPVAHTCFNLLDLPRYRTKEKLKYKLLQAIQQTQGFSLV
ncbi:probable E3 ubiquitin-protein ligase HERC4 isoform X2 [Lutzomyia longipalpis]|uniref:Putative hect e3 ubiquitin ligase n=1 Tax=Lutzomyia longipalpis TaxID=7200 RepID=A0A7G3ALN5_LUTLO|nr:probable E3 ubiquitin-protein ligase HERC4 isoform X2 [Lutzomyia longipalpis]XP_055691065.1 probable E3 ubiquitin-protein ligase HERC4 isoform X2 [Lutzomyia longipalpis]